VAADQSSKSWAVGRLPGHPIDLFGPVGFRLQYNTGVAFSIGRGLTGPVVVLAVVLIAAVAFFARLVPNRLTALAIGLILGGAVSNLGDRLFRGHHGAVIDFLYTKYWPTFNLADASIVCGCILVLIFFLRSGRRSAR
jgi:signal peptidase II